MAETVRVEEAYTERDETINAQGAVTEIEIPYLVFGVADGGARVRHDWWSKSGGVTEFLVNCLPCDAQGTFKRTDAATW